MINNLLTIDSFHKINEKMNRQQRKEWNNFQTELYQSIDYIRDRTRMGSEDLTLKVNYLMELISTIPTFD